MENKMAEVAKLVGLELEEEFRMGNCSTKYKLTKNGFMYWSDDYQQWNYTCGIEELFLGESQIIKIDKPILDDIEKKYLSNVIKPFRDKVIGITKYNYSNNGEYIHIKLKRTISPVDYFIPLESINLPIFKRGIMYKGMELDKEYTLEQLEL